MAKRPHDHSLIKVSVHGYSPISGSNPSPHDNVLGSTRLSDKQQLRICTQVQAFPKIYVAAVKATDVLRKLSGSGADSVDVSNLSGRIAAGD